MIWLMRAPRQTLPGIAFVVTIAALLSACGVRAAAVDPPRSAHTIPTRASAGA